MIELGEVLKGNVPESGTIREQIEYIDIGLIDSDPNNFYELSDVDGLASNIALCGLQQPIRVRTNPDDLARVIIVSGHRRRAAIEQLVNEGREDLREIPCIREQRTGSAALQELQLIYANSDTRRMSNADLNRQVERVTALLYQLKEEGIEFPGRMRDHVAEACKISKTKLSNLKVIRDGLEPNTWMRAWEEGKVAESVALVIARMPIQHQLKCWSEAKRHAKLEYYYESEAKHDSDVFKAIDGLRCPEGGTCAHVDEKFEACYGKYYSNCSGLCCGDCSDLGTCKHACPHFYERIKQIKADRKEERKQEQLAKEESERPKIQQIQQFWNRFGKARNAADKTVEECYKALGMYFSRSDEEKVVNLECLEAKFSVFTNLPYGYSCYLDDVMRYVKIADLLGCSIDYLLCRTDEPGFSAAKAPAKSEAPAHSGGVWHPATEFPAEGQEIVVVTEDGFASDETYKNSALRPSALHWDEVRFWSPMPDYDGKVAAPEGQMMFCSWMPGGTTPAEPCDVVAVFDLGDRVKNKTFLRWTGSEFTFPSGARVEMEPTKWMRLPPDEDIEVDLEEAAEAALDEEGV